MYMVWGCRGYVGSQTIGGGLECWLWKPRSMSPIYIMGGFLVDPPHPTLFISHHTMEADSKTRADVDCMMLDYLVCIAIDALLSQPRRPEQDVNWLVDSVRGME